MPSTDSGERIYAVGDVHGRYDLLCLLLARIGEHAQSLPPARATHVVFLGDIIDRGPQSAEALGALYDLHRAGGRTIVLLGNHEEMMLAALDGKADALRGWLALGGRETLRSLRLDDLRPGEDARDYLRRVRAAVPREWVAWLRKLPLSVQSGDYLFVHAGIRPGVPLRRQTRTDLLWIREDFLDDESNHGAVVVHGHSISRTPQIRPNRIGIDTGAYRTGVLTAIYLEGDQREVISVSLPAAPSDPARAAEGLDLRGATTRT